MVKKTKNCSSFSKPKESNEEANTSSVQSPQLNSKRSFPAENNEEEKVRQMILKLNFQLLISLIIYILESTLHNKTCQNFAI